MEKSIHSLNNYLNILDSNNLLKEYQIAPSISVLDNPMASKT
jgi:hypothetical protein